jgi:AraC family transcriptional regulator, exoenzyme S synthesis regulatory protein ExsA
MPTLNIPEIFLSPTVPATDLLIHDFRMTSDVVKSKVKLHMHMLSFLQTGKKQVHFSDAVVGVNDQQSLLTKSGNCLWTELLDNDEIYFCKLFFFSDAHIAALIHKHPLHFPTSRPSIEETAPYFIIENDEFIRSFVQSLTAMLATKSALIQTLAAVKFEEIMLYLVSKYGTSFADYAQSLIANDHQTSFQKIVHANAYSNLSLEEIAFLCNMSLSTFKRHFLQEFKETPGKWLQNKRLSRAYELLKEGSKTPTEIYLDFGYNNLSNFSAAFKHKFNATPKEIAHA